MIGVDLILLLLLLFHFNVPRNKSIRKISFENWLEFKMELYPSFRCDNDATHHHSCSHSISLWAHNQFGLLCLVVVKRFFSFRWCSSLLLLATKCRASFVLWLNHLLRLYNFSDNCFLPKNKTKTVFDRLVQCTYENVERYSC